MSFTIPRKNGPMRLWTVALGIIIFIWSGLEDHDVITVTVLSLILSLTCCAGILVSRYGGKTLAPGPLTRLAIAFGSLTGALSCLMVAALMIFKVLRHFHAFPDYPLALILAMLERLPAWTIAGGLIGLGLSLLLTLIADGKHHQA